MSHNGSGTYRTKLTIKIKQARSRPGLLRAAQKDERSLKSGWTLPEGILLASTRLFNGYRNTFSDSGFYNGH
jgi:hypothetical protein